LPRAHRLGTRLPQQDLALAWEFALANTTPGHHATNAIAVALPHLLPHAWLGKQRPVEIREALPPDLGGSGYGLTHRKPSVVAFQRNAQTALFQARVIQGRTVQGGE